MIIGIVSVLWGILEVALGWLFGTHFPSEILIVSWIAGIPMFLLYVLKRLDSKIESVSGKIAIKTSFVILLIFLLISDFILFLSYINTDFFMLYVPAIFGLSIIGAIVVVATYIIGRFSQ